MSRLPDDEPQALDLGEAYQRCMREIARPYPDHEAAQLCAVLSLEETAPASLIGGSTVTG